MMKLHLKKVFIAVLAMGLAGGVTSCKKEKPEPSGTGSYSEKMQAVADQFVNATVVPTYTKLAEASDRLVEAIATLKSAKTDANVSAACQIFLEAREWWEKSEAFLFGPASDFGIDPHIDSWPLDEDAFNSLMNSPEMLSALDAEDGDVVAGERLGATLLGFHGIEYILFENGQPKAASKISDNDMVYALAVAGDLRNCCYQLEVSWAGSSAPKAHQERIEELEWNSTVAGSGSSYGENLRNAGKAGSTYISLTQAMMAIVDGCKTIADEVGTSKIGKAYTGEDKDYIESPYSQKSITDFANNIISICNAYMGGLEGERNQEKSLQNLMSTVNPTLNERAVKTMEDAKQTILNMKAPFVNNYTDASAKAAMEACAAVDDVLSEVYDALKSVN